ncbi:MAG: hypothetical protein ABIC04_03830 [Nanoarchaeota archaeon]
MDVHQRCLEEAIAEYKRDQVKRCTPGRLLRIMIELHVEEITGLVNTMQKNINPPSDLPTTTLDSALYLSAYLMLGNGYEQN